MIREIGTIQFSPFWPVRKLLICFTIVNNPSKTEFSISDFMFPVRYPRSIRTDTWEVVQVYQCLHQLQEEGISVVKEWLDPLYFVFSDSKEDKGTLKKLGKRLGQLRSTHFEQHWDDKQLTPEEIAKEYVLPRFLNFKLAIKRTTLNKKLREACKQFFESVSNKGQHFFGKPFCNQVFERFFRTMQFRQGNRFRFNFGILVEEDYEISDEFVDIFSKHFTYEFDLWKKGIYQFPFFWYLIQGHLNKRFTVQNIIAQVDDLRQFEQGSIALDWLGFDRVPLVSSLLVSLSEERKTVPPRGSPITTIEVVPGDHPQFIVYVNQQYHHPILLSKKQRSGLLIYEIAINLYAPLDTHRKAFDYIRRDRRFKLFSQSGAVFTQILETDGDGGILPAEGVRFRIHEE